MQKSPVTKWLSQDYLVKPIDNSTITLQSPEGPVDIVSHPKFVKIVEAQVVAKPHRPVYNVMHAKRLDLIEEYTDYNPSNPRFKAKEVVEIGDVIGITQTQIRPDEEGSHIADGLHKVSFGHAMYVKKGDRVEALSGWVIIELDDLPEYEGALIMPDTRSEKPYSGVVKYSSETAQEKDINPGDRVVFTKNMEIPIVIDDQPLVAVAEGQIMGKYE